jgi:hypothetical protein
VKSHGLNASADRDCAGLRRSRLSWFQVRHLQASGDRPDVALVRLPATLKDAALTRAEELQTAVRRGFSPASTAGGVER